MVTDLLHQEITEKVIKAFYNVFNKLGFGFLEKVYINSLLIELRKLGFSTVKQQRILVYYDGIEVGEYFADLVIDDVIIIEVKAAECLCEEHEFQLLNYLKATDKEVGLLLNFGKIPAFKRKIFRNSNKYRNAD